MDTSTNCVPSDKFERARLARDHRFDGHFFVGVLTTGIYCRPICPANLPKRENIRFYPSAAAASEAGFRPCLRCRPECAPGSPAWSGTSTTVRRGLRLIAGGALDSGNVEQLAERLGVSGRHLRRLFSKHIGASPLSVAHTQRLHFAKRLIDETWLPLAAVAGAAGYGSVRRFNDAFRKTYGKSPRQLRRVGAPQPGPEEPAMMSVRLACRQPFDWQSVLNFFGPRVTPGVEQLSDATYSRTLNIDGSHAAVSVCEDDKPGYLRLTLHGVDTQALFATVQHAREVFDLDAPVADIETVLGVDPLLASALRSNPGIRVPGAWGGFELTVRAILGQQISVKAATTLAGRIAARYGEPFKLATSNHNALQVLFPEPERLARARFNGIGLVKSRAETLRRLAAAVVSGEITFDASQEPTYFRASLKSLKGIGDWTAEYVAMRVLKDPDAFPASDLGLLKALYSDRRATEKELSARAEGWRPWRAYAALLLWNRLSGSGG